MPRRRRPSPRGGGPGTRASRRPRGPRRSDRLGEVREEHRDEHGDTHARRRSGRGRGPPTRGSRRGRCRGRSRAPSRPRRAPSMFLRSAPPMRSISASPSVNTAHPANRPSATSERRPGGLERLLDELERDGAEQDARAEAHHEAEGAPAHRDPERDRRRRSGARSSRRHPTERFEHRYEAAARCAAPRPRRALRPRRGSRRSARAAPS